MRKGRSIGIVSRFKNRQGFALILVFSLASFVLLIGLSLVSLTQVETASSQYDQGLRVARANARLALQMAIGDLQMLAGPDQRATATADGARIPTSDDFNDAADGSTSGVYQPFWTGVWDVNNATDNPRWLVTRPLDATYTLDTGTQDADPFASDLGSTKKVVKLVGDGSAEPEPGFTQDFHEVEVPKEPILSDNIVGLADTEEATIGHYAYWVGDNGVKASYLLENRLLETLHDDYDDSSTTSYEKERLEQMLAHRYRIERAGAEMDATDARIAAIVNEFVLRNAVDGTGGTYSYLGIASGAFTQNDVRSRFHDFAGMHRGLLVDPIRGGLKEDLSYIHSVDTGDANVDDLVNNFLMPYLNVSDIVSSSTPLTDLTRSYPIAAKNTTFGGGGPTPKIAPVITEFHLEIRMGAPELGIGLNPDQRRGSPIFAQFGVAVEIWNPYTSRLNGTDLRLRIDNPNTSGLSVDYYDNGVLDSSNAIAGLGAIMNGVSEFSLDTSGTWWEPGEIRVFSGSYVDGVGLVLSPGSAIPTGSSYEYEVGTLPTFESSDEVYTFDQIALDGPIWSPELSLRTSGGDLLQTATLSGISFYEMKTTPRPVLPPLERQLSYKWELRNPDTNWAGYDPRSGLITSTLIMDNFVAGDPPDPYVPLSLPYFRFPGSSWAFMNSSIQSSVNDLLGYNNDASIENNIPIFELPRQEHLSLAALQIAEFPSGKRGHLGASNSSVPVTISINEVFDRFFLSTVPQSSSTSWTVENPLPNSRMQPLAGTSLADLQDPDSAGHFFLNASFNVNSTSIEAWGALLKGIRLGTWAYDDPLGTTPVAGQDEVDVTDENQFFRFSQSAEETWLGSYAATDLSRSRKFFRKGLRSLSDSEVESLAVQIVNQIRVRRQSGLGGGVGPFVSLRDFVDSGVIELAIANTTINSAVAVSSVPLTYSSSFLTQQDVLTGIAPYLTTRSDTYLVRAYGDAVNPFDASEVVARAYCEAIVQRLHQKHPSEPDAADPMTIAGANAGEYGRQFRVIAFRWMTGDEI